MGYSKLSSQFKTFTISIDNIVIPKDIYHALEDEKWKAIIMDEMHALEANNKTWDIIYLPDAKNIVGNKWIFTVKYK